MNKETKNRNDQIANYQELLDENSDLRARIALMEDASNSRAEKLRLLSGAAKIGYWERDEVAQKMIYYSEGMARIFGLSRHEMETDFNNRGDFNKCLHRDDLDYYIAQTQQGCESRADPTHAHAFNYRILRPDGEIRYLSEVEYGLFNEHLQLTGSYGLVQDVTDYRTAFNNLQQSEERISNLFDQLPLGVQEDDYSAAKKMIDKLQYRGIADIQKYLLDNPRVLKEMLAGVRITRVNDALMKIHGASSKEEFLKGEADIDDWWDAGWVEIYARELFELTKRDSVCEIERLDTRIDGSLFEARTITSVMRGYENSWSRVITIHEDISNRKRGESALIEAKLLAEEASQAKSDFLSSMSHELRTPLNAILGFSQLFEYDTTLPEHHHTNAREIHRAGKHLMSLIEDMLDLSKIESGKMSVSLEPVSIYNVLDDGISWITPMAQSKEVIIDYDADQFINVRLIADVVRLKQVFLNLLTNAIKYNRQGGKISILSGRDFDGFYKIGIRDTGKGISEGRIKELFQPFNRLGAEFSEVEGTGIGLMITRQLVDLMGGRLDIQSSEGEGSTFWVALPSEPGRDNDYSSTAFDLDQITDTTPISDDSNVRILVAEDNLINQELMRAQMDLIGYQADFVINGAEALNAWKSGDYSVLLTDIRMPMMDGFELIRAIRLLEADTATPLTIIVVTANVMQRDVQKCFDLRANDVLSKPVELEELRQKMEKWVPHDVAQRARLKHVEEDLRPRPGQAIDIAVLRELVGDKPELHQQLLSSYVESLAYALQNIDNAFAWRNHEQVAEYAHKLKSSTKSMGAIKMARACQQLEIAGLENRWPELESIMPGFRREAEHVSSFIQSFCQFPLNQASPQAVEVDDEVTEIKLRVLIVDDDYILHRVTTLILNDLGIFNVKSALSGAKALQILRENFTTVDVIFCDLNMPGMDGVEFIRNLADEEFAGSLILSSGEDVRILKTVEKLAIEHQLKVLGVMEKPPTPAKISDLLDTLENISAEGTMLLNDDFKLIELVDAIKLGQLDIYFQPKLDLASGRVVGLEALVRWNHPTIGLVLPSAFIPMAEENDLISDLTEAVCDMAIQYGANLQAQGFDLNIAMNISVDTLSDLEWPDQMARKIDESGLQPSNITFEITESRLMEHISIALDILSRLSLKRFNLSIDDFGTGYSSMEQLQRIPFSELKIDRAFVHGSSDDSSARAILESSVLLAKKLEMKVVAEGVENRRDLDLLVELGCDQVQGYLVSKPLPFDRLASWLHGWQTDGD